MYFILKGKRIAAIAVSCLALIIVSVMTVNLAEKHVETKIAVAAAASVNWGLGFGEPGTVPRGNASAEFLRQYDTYYVGDATRKIIYLTFDAGYENGYMPSILDTLKKHNIKAAFFLVGNYITTSPELVKRMEAEGHIVGNHTYNHPDMSKISNAESFKEELTELETLYKQTVGKDMPKYYRPPQGKYSESNLELAKEMGYKTVFWSLAYVDWYVDKQPTADQAFSKLVPRIHPGAVVLLHSTSKTNAEILDELITRWKAQGYSFGTVDQL